VVEIRKQNQVKKTRALFPVAFKGKSHGYVSWQHKHI